MNPATPTTPARRGALSRLASFGGTLIMLGVLGLLVAAFGAAIAGLSHPERPTCAGREMTPRDTCVTTTGDQSIDDVVAHEQNTQDMGDTLVAVGLSAGLGALGLGVVLKILGGAARRRVAAADPVPAQPAFTPLPRLGGDR